MERLMGRLAVGSVVLALLSACTPLHLAERVRPSQPGERPAVAGRSAEIPRQVPADHDARTSLPAWAVAPPLSPGDRLQVDVRDGDGFSGRYEIDVDGMLRLPYLAPLAAAGRTPAGLEHDLAEALVRQDFFRRGRVGVSIRVREWAHAQVNVQGAVFNPGLVSVNVRSPEERALKSDMASGDFPAERMLHTALRSAGGVRPDARIERVRLTRQGKTLEIDYSGLLDGNPVVQVPLMAGDTIEVQASGSFDPALVKPSVITPPGIRVFLSNLTVPATGNAASANGKDSSSLPYGTRLLTGAISANCVGGTNLTNASRHIVLVRHDPIGDQEPALSRSVNTLLAQTQDATVNPWLMPNDSISCYDSGITNLRDIARTVIEILSPASLLWGTR